MGFENPLRIDKVIGMSLVYYFFGTHVYWWHYTITTFWDTVYVGCYFQPNSCRVDRRQHVRKYTMSQKTL